MVLTPVTIFAINQNMTELEPETPTVKAGLISCIQTTEHHIKADVWLNNPFEDPTTFKVTVLGTDEDGTVIATNTFRMYNVQGNSTGYQTAYINNVDGLAECSVSVQGAQQ